MNEEEVVIKTAQKKYDKLLDEKNNLDKGVRKLKAELAQNKTNQ